MLQVPLPAIDLDTAAQHAPTVTQGLPEHRQDAPGGLSACRGRRDAVALAKVAGVPMDQNARAVSTQNVTCGQRQRARAMPQKAIPWEPIWFRHATPAGRRHHQCRPTLRLKRDLVR